MGIIQKSVVKQMVELNGKKILVTFLMHLGDLTLTTPFIHALRKAAPDSHIAMLVDEKLKDVVLFNPYLDEVITIDKKGRDNSILALIACARHLSKHKFDVLINLHPNERCSFIDALTSVKLRTGRLIPFLSGAGMCLRRLTALCTRQICIWTC